MLEAIVTVLITLSVMCFVLGILAYIADRLKFSGPFWSKFWRILGL